MEDSNRNDKSSGDAEVGRSLDNISMNVYTNFFVKGDDQIETVASSLRVEYG